MRVIFIILVFISFHSYCKSRLTPVDYILYNKVLTANATLHHDGYGYNLTAKNIVKLVTLDWPPYIDENLCNKGWLYQLTVKLLLQQGYGVHIEFYPWARAVREAELGKADILFPEYYVADDVLSDNLINKTRNQLLALSAPLPGGELSFVTLKGTKISYDGTIASVKNQLIGVVRGYKNTEQLDQLIEAGEINTIVANNEYQLIHLLLSKRVSLIVADLEVLKASVHKSVLSNTEKQSMIAALVALQPSLEYKHLYYQVSKANPEWQAILTAINSEIKNITASGELANFITEKTQQCYKNTE
ncbi:substrate-binding periplasmic protein [Pseudoalteromonas mariniglutinosa]|uniref:substrate-binding periplasmic protein n=1 Tax=Pseudoalteromonas mariniglutinosa TaxID=206042 RepID=UPI00384E44F3